MASSHKEDIDIFFKKIYPLMHDYLIQNNIPITALMRDFYLKDVKRCSEFGKSIACDKGQWRSKNFSNCMFINNLLYKDYVYFEERDLIHFYLKTYFINKVKFWSNKNE